MFPSLIHLFYQPAHCVNPRLTAYITSFTIYLCLIDLSCEYQSNCYTSFLGIGIRMRRLSFPLTSTYSPWPSSLSRRGITSGGTTHDESQKSSLLLRQTWCFFAVVLPFPILWQIPSTNHPWVGGQLERLTGLGLPTASEGASNRKSSVCTKYYALRMF